MTREERLELLETSEKMRKTALSGLKRVEVYPPSSDSDEEKLKGAVKYLEKHGVECDFCMEVSGYYGFGCSGYLEPEQADEFEELFY